MKNMKKIKKMKKTDLVKNMTAQVSITGLSSRDARVEQGGLEPWQITISLSSYSSISRYLATVICVPLCPI